MPKTGNNLQQFLSIDFAALHIINFLSSNRNYKYMTTKLVLQTPLSLLSAENNNEVYVP